MNEQKYSVGPGWWPILDEYLAKARAVVPDVVFTEKEKYGRCDMRFWSEELYGSSTELFEIEREVEKQSLKTCEYCGRPGKPREQFGWLTTMCDRCAALDQVERSRIQDETKKAYWNENDTDG